MERKRKRIYLGVGALAALGLIAAIVASGGTPVETVAAAKGDIVKTVEDIGYVQPSTGWDLFAAQSGKVIEVAVETGERLEELLAAGAVTQAEYDQARTAAETARKLLEEQEHLVDSARAQAAGMQELLENLKAGEQQLVLKSPASGEVLYLGAEVGQVLVPGALVASIAVPGQLEVKADILSDDLAEVRQGQRVMITAPVLGGKVLEGRVAKIYPRAEEKVSALGVIQRRVPVIISLSDTGNLKAGYEVRVAIETVSRSDVLVLPRESVRTAADGSKEVLSIVGGRVRHQKVQTGISDRRHVEITEGLQAGDLVVRDSSLDLKEKAKVKAGL